jgi:hypothetical protein
MLYLWMPVSIYYRKVVHDEFKNANSFVKGSVKLCARAY